MKKLFLINLDNKVCKSFCNKLSPSFVEVSTRSELFERCIESDQGKCVLKYRSQDVIPALAKALRENFLLELDTKAYRINLDNDYESDVLVLVEDSNFIGSIVAINYASLYNAHLLKIESSTKEESEKLAALLRRYDEVSSALEREKICLNIEEVLRAKIPSREFAKYRFLIFFTFGMPYGLLFRQHACTHFPIYPESGLFTLKNVLFHGYIRSALLVESGYVDSKEEKLVRELISSKGAVVKTLKAKNSTIQNVDFHLSQLPYNLIIFATHGGFTKGNRLTIAYKDGKNREDIITIRKADSFSIIPGTDKVLVHSFIEPEKINGIPFESADSEQLRLGWNIIENLEQYFENGLAKTLKVEEGIAMSHSNSIKLSDGNYFVSFVETGDKCGPVVINNICGSAQLMPTHFLYGGTRMYIGTLTSILDIVANDFAEKILSTELPLSEIICEFNKQHFGESKISGYILYGSHTYRLRVLDNNNLSFFCDEIQDCIERVERFLESNPFYSRPDQMRWIIKRLNKELSELMTANTN